MRGHLLGWISEQLEKSSGDFLFQWGWAFSASA